MKNFTCSKKKKRQDIPLKEFKWEKAQQNRMR